MFVSADRAVVDEASGPSFIVLSSFVLTVSSVWDSGLMDCLNAVDDGNG